SVPSSRGEARGEASVPPVTGEGEGWQVHYAFFAREGFTEAARNEAGRYSSLLTTLAEMEPEFK
ncbi:MAG: hypothetical protein Q8N45_03045, partial [Anaerolineales bacterium]|nr:hypothetical protein [Anaerolineales bacterium]